MQIDTVNHSRVGADRFTKPVTGVREEKPCWPLEGTLVNP